MSIKTITVKTPKKIIVDVGIFDENIKIGQGTLGNAAQHLIGRPVNRTTNDVKTIIDDLTVGGKRLGAVTAYNGYGINTFRYGKDVKFLKHLSNDNLSPNITLGREGLVDGDDIFDNTIDQYNFGQNKHYKTKSDITLKLIPFTDFEGKPDVKSFLKKKQSSVVGFPYVHNGKQSFAQYTNPEIAAIDGAIDIFHVRSSPISSGFNDIQIRGTKGLFGVGNWILSQHTTYGRKGSSFLSDVYSKKETSHDFYEDSQDVLLTKSVDGYVSEGLYKNSPFVEEDLFKDNYTQLSDSQKVTLLSKSSRNEASIGKRFKSRENGFMITPFYQKNEKRSFGKDSIAFNGLLKR